VVGGKEGHADGVGAGRREVVDALLGEHGAQEAVGDLDQDAGAVAGVGLSAGGATVRQVRQRDQAGSHQLVAAHTLDVGDEGDPARVVLESRVVETIRARR
jgi:hypothetical protein